MNVVNLENAGLLKGGVRGRKYRDKNVIWTRDKPIINVQPKYNLDSLNVRRVKANSKTNGSDLFKTPVGLPLKKTPGSSSVRPKSSSSVPTDGKSTSSPDTAIDSYVILAITSGRGEASCEIGMAAMDLQYPHLIISQISDTQTFTSTMTNINLFQPIEIVMPDTMCIPDQLRCKLYSSIREKYKQILVSSISRQHFNKTEGLERVKIHASQEYSSVELVIKEKYYALAATAALFKYIEHIQHVTHAPKSMKVEFQCSQNKMLIDVDSAQNLELVSCLSSYPKCFNLYGALNRCQTRIGRCQLRASILQPSCDKAFITQRQNCITELLSNRQLHTLIIPILRRFGGMDKLLHGLCVKTLNTADDDNVKIAERKLNYILTLKNTLETIPELQKLLENTKSQFFVQVYKNLGDSRFQLMLNQILEIVHKDAQCVVGYTSSNMQRCFAIKAGKNDMLDVARQTYCELIDTMKDEVENYSNKYRMDLSLACTSLLGYHIQMPVPKRVNFEISDLPKIFLNVEKKRNVIYMTTSWLQVMSLHCKDASEELHVMSAVLLEELMESLRESIVCLYQLSADIAELDQIASLARISAIPEFVKPTFGEKLQVLNSKNPVKYILSDDDIVPNDINVSTSYNLSIITGPNMSGKTTYLKQVVLLQIMAQIGCRVPATCAQFRISDRIFCRISPRDSLECTSSTFVMEMKEVQNILKSLTAKSLIILDEPCNSTAVDEGTSLAWTICSKLSMSSAFTFVSTHFLYLTQISDVYFNIKNFHLECLLEEVSNGTLEFKYKLKPGITPISNYGIAVLKMSAFPKTIIEESERLANQLSKGIKKITVKNKDEIESIDEICYGYFAKLSTLEEDSELDYASYHAITDEIRKDPRLKNLTPLENTIRMTKPTPFDINIIPENNHDQRVVLSKPNKKPVIEIQTVSNNERTNNESVTRDIVSIVSAGVNKSDSTGNSVGNKDMYTSSEDKDNRSNKDASPRKINYAIAIQGSEKVNRQNIDNYHHSMDTVISRKYANLSITPNSKISISPLQNFNLNTLKTTNDNVSLQSFLHLSSTSKQSLSEKLDKFRKSIKKSTMSTNNSSSLNSSENVSIKKGCYYDQTSILKDYTKPVSNLGRKRCSKIYMNEPSSFVSKLSDMPLPTVDSVGPNVSEDFRKCFNITDLSNSITSSQATTIDINEYSKSPGSITKKTNLIFPREIFEKNVLLNDSNQNIDLMSQKSSSLSKIPNHSISSLSLQDFKVNIESPPSDISNYTFFPSAKDASFNNTKKTNIQDSLMNQILTSQILTANDSQDENDMTQMMLNEKSLSIRYVLGKNTADKMQSKQITVDPAKSPLVKKRRLEKNEASIDDIKIMTSSAIKEAEIFRQIEGSNFDENMFYESLGNKSTVDENDISFCKCSYISSDVSKSLN